MYKMRLGHQRLPGLLKGTKSQLKKAPMAKDGRIWAPINQPINKQCDKLKQNVCIKIFAFTMVLKQTNTQKTQWLPLEVTMKGTIALFCQLISKRIKCLCGLSLCGFHFRVGINDLEECPWLIVRFTKASRRRVWFIFKKSNIYLRIYIYLCGSR